MPTNFRPGVLPDDEPRRRPGQEIGRAFDDFIVGREQIRAGERADRRETRADERHDIDLERDRFGFRGELEDEGFVPADRSGEQFDRTGRGGPAARPGQVPPGLQDRDPFEGRGVGMAAEFDRFREAGPEAMRKPIVLPGQFVPGAGFSPTAVFEPEQEAPTETFMGQEYRRDPSRTPEAREQAAFQQEVDRLIQAGVPPHQAEAVAEQGAAGSYLGPQEGGRMRYTEDELRSAGVPEGAIPAAMRNPELAEDLINEAHRRMSPGSGRGPDGFRVGDFETALELVNEEYGEYDEEGFLVGFTLDRQERFRLADQLASGELRPEDLPAAAASAPAPEEGGEEGGGFWRGVGRAFGEMREGAAQATEAQGGASPEAGFSQRESNVVPEAIRPQVEEAQSIIQEEFPNASDEQLREILRESQYSPAAIDAILGSGR